jgi:hypothetical protein
MSDGPIAICRTANAHLDIPWHVDGDALDAKAVRDVVLPELVEYQFRAHLPTVHHVRDEILHRYIPVELSARTLGLWYFCDEVQIEVAKGNVLLTNNTKWQGKTRAGRKVLEEGISRREGCEAAFTVDVIPLDLINRQCLD